MKQRHEYRRLLLRLALTQIVVCGALAAAELGATGLAVTATISALGTVRFVGYGHALLHAARGRSAWYTELVLPPLSMALPGVTQMRRSHRTHHRFTNRPQDPELWAARAPTTLGAWIRCAFMLESWLVRSIARGELDRGQWAGLLARGIIFVALTLCLDPVLWWVGYLLPARIALGFTFLAVCHRGPEVGRRSPAWHAFNQVVHGLYVANTLHYHERHHEHPAMPALDLAT